jgi:inner membrane protein
MYQTGHYGAALLAYAPVGYLLLGWRPELALVGGAGVLMLATLPDTDQRIPLVRHRGPTHSLLFLALVAGVLGAFGWFLGESLLLGTQFELALFGALVGTIGVGSHLLADMLTPAGINLFWPLPFDPYSLYVTRADDTLANWVLLALGVFVTAGVLLVAAPG